MHKPSSVRRVRFQWLVANLVAVSLLAGAVSLPTTSAFAAEKGPIAAARVQKFVPGKINKTPVGGPIPADAKLEGKALSPSLLANEGEVVERRTERSRT